MIYSALKAAHVASVIIFVGGVLVDAVFLSIASGSGQPAISAVRRWGRTVTTPAMLLAWTLGLTMALQQGWFASFWLPTKLAFVLLLSALHGMQSGRLRRLEGGQTPAPNAMVRLGGLLTVGSVVAIAFLAVMKPG